MERKSWIERFVDSKFKRNTQSRARRETQATTRGGQSTANEASTSRVLPPIVEPDSRQASHSLWSPNWSFGAGSLNQPTVSPPLKREPKNYLLGFEHEVTNFLKDNPAFLESYILKNLPAEELKKLLAKKYVQKTKTKQQLQRYEEVLSVYKDLFLKIARNFDAESSEHVVICQITRLVSITLDTESRKTFKLSPDSVERFVEPSEDILRHLVRADPDEEKAIFKVAKVGKPIKDSIIEKHMLYIPIFRSNGIVTYVMELGRSTEYSDIDVETSGQYIVWGSLLMHYCNRYLDKKGEKMSDFLLDVVRAIFEEMVSLDQLIKRILEFAQRLVDADRASLFLVDYKNAELVSTVFDLKFEPGQSRDVEKKEIRMPIDRGIAGHVASYGETMNIPDAYSDHRFNRAVDEATGYKTKCILCMPIKVQGKVIGVVQMVNKRTKDQFDHEDESEFEIFSSFFGLALHHARLYDRIMRKEQKYRVALEVLSYHNTCRENDVTAMLADTEEITSNLNEYYLDPYLFDEFQKCKAVIKMFDHLFDISKFDLMTLTRFILTVKKNYRTVPYHNFDHGWSVAHAMYVILRHDSEARYSYKMRLSLFIACLCHDLDHRGYTNKYMSETASPLAAMYTTSTLEHHHFNITVTILQQDGHNIFSQMSSDEYKDILGLIRHCILATDLAAFFPNLAKIKELQSAEAAEAGFNWSTKAHTELAMAISMTAADLSASAKPWKIQIKTVKVIFEEFYDQGDKERQAGRPPIPMMDRNQPDEQPASQVGFLSQICIPCYSSLSIILPNTKPMYDMAKINLNKWKCKAYHILRKKAGDLKDIGSDLEAEIFDDVEIPEDLIIGTESRPESTVSEDTLSTDVEPAIQVESEESDTVMEVIKRSSSSWEDEEEDSSGQRVRSQIWKDIDGVAWIDEEGLVVGPRKTQKKSDSDGEDK